MERETPEVQFERYADDIVIHAQSQEEAENLKARLEIRLEECKLQLNPDKTCVVYCKDEKRLEEHAKISFTFLGYTFKPRKAVKKNGKLFTGFLPAVGNKAKSKFRERIKKTKILKTTQLAIEDLALKLNPIVRGWCIYFSSFYSSEMNGTLHWLNKRIVSWFQRKYRLPSKTTINYFKLLASRNPKLFWHWTLKPFSERAV